MKAKWWRMALLAMAALTLPLIIAGCTSLNSDKGQVASAQQTQTESKSQNQSQNQSQENADDQAKIDSYAIVNEAVIFSDEAKAVLGHRDARRAIALAIDKEQLVSRVLLNTGQVTNALVPKDLVVMPNGKDFREQYPNGWHQHNKEAAQAMWAKALDELGVRTVTLHLMIMNSDQVRSVGKHIKAQLEQTLPGLTLKLNSYAFAKKMEMSSKGRYGLELMGWGPDYPDPMTYLDLFHTDSPLNTSGFSDANYDEIIKNAKQGSTPETQEERLLSLQEAERLLISERAMAIPLYQTAVPILSKPYVTGIVKQSFGGRFFYKYADTTYTVEGLKTLRTMTQSEIQSLDTVLAQDVNSFEVLSNVMEGLVTMGPEGQLAPGVASSWDISEDGKIYTFHLNRNAKWSNGIRVTAKDFVFAWQRLANPITQSPYSNILETAQIKGASQVIRGEKPVETLGVEAVDDFTLIVHLENPTPYFLKLMSFASFYPQSKDFVAYQGTAYGQSAEAMIYNGPYTLNQWDIGYGYVMTRNSHYWDRGNVMLHTMSFRMYKSEERAMTDYFEGRLDRCMLSVSQADTHRNDPEFSLSEEPTLFYLTFNVDNYD